MDIRKQKVLIVGGHSPIAMAIANKLSTSHNVSLLTRKIDASIQMQIKDQVELVEGDVTKMIELSSSTNSFLPEITSIVFAHRFRGDENNIEECLRCELLEPYELITKLVENTETSNLRNIIFFTSPSAKRILDDQALSYHIAKSALSQLVRYLAVRYARYGIKVVGISPSSFVAKQRSVKFYNENRALKERIESKIPSGKFLSCEEIAEVTDSILASEGIALSGNILDLDHGLGHSDAAGLIR